MIHSKDLDFSFSGLKTAVLYLTQRFGTIDDQTKKGIAREIEDSIVETVVKKTTDAIDAFNAQSLIIGGGVIANTRMREALSHVANERGIPLFLPEISHATDNALMIAVAAWFSKDKILSEGPKAQGGLSLQKTQ